MRDFTKEITVVGEQVKSNPDSISHIKSTIEFLERRASDSEKRFEERLDVIREGF